MNKKITASAVISGILASVICLEGGYTDDPYDAGGKTKYGITERVARDYGYTGLMQDLTKDQANEIYTALYVKEPGFDKFALVSPALAHKLIDAGVNVGTARVSLWFQHSLNAYSKNGGEYPTISEDGIIGPNTVNAYKALERKRGKDKACSLVLKALDGQQLTYYMSLKQYNRYLVGWVDKRVNNVPVNQCSNYTLTLPLSVSDENQ